MIDAIENVKTIRVIVTKNDDDSTVVFDKTFDIAFRDVYDWQDWTYAPTEYRRRYERCYIKVTR